jgi:hypothetical protein
MSSIDIVDRVEAVALDDRDAHDVGAGAAERSREGAECTGPVGQRRPEVVTRVWVCGPLVGSVRLDEPQVPAWGRCCHASMITTASVRGVSLTSQPCELCGLARFGARNP